ncbi:MAG: DUF6502 family protein [Candidatus Binatia bacterium]
MKKEDSAEQLVHAAAEILRPLVKRLLEANVPFGRLEARLRELFVEIAEREFALEHRPQTDSRVALLTGINRKEVHRIRSGDDAAKPAPAKFGRNHAASLVSRWLTDPRACDASGKPLPLPYRAARGPSFVRLAREVAADLPPRAILDELLRSGAIRLEGDDRIALQSDSYVPAHGANEKLDMLAEDPAQLVETMLRNVLEPDGEPLLQRKVFYDNLGADGAGRARAEARRAGEKFLRTMNALLARYDRDRNPKAPGGGRRGAGVGVYFFETAPDETPAPVHGIERKSGAPRRKRPKREPGK